MERCRAVVVVLEQMMVHQIRNPREHGESGDDRHADTAEREFAREDIAAAP